MFGMPSAYLYSSHAQRVRSGFYGFLLLVIASALAACGGDGGSGGGGGGPTLTIDGSASISVQDTTGSSASRTVTINFTIVNSGSLLNAGDILVTPVTFNGVPIESAITNFVSGGAGSQNSNYTLTVQLWPANTLGAGTFQGSIVLEACHNLHSTAGCDQQLGGSPVTIPVTYTVTGNARPDTTATLDEPALSLEAPDSATTGPGETTFTLSLSLVSPGPFVTFSQPAGGFVTSVSYTASNEEQGFLSIAYISPSTLAPGTYTENLTINVCVDPQCNHPVANSPIIMAVTYVVDASVGVDFTSQTVPIEANDFAWSAAQSKLYAVVSAYSVVDTKMLAEIDPTTGAVTRTFALAGNPQALALSDDGSCAYVSFSDTSLIQRVVLASFTSDLSINLGSTAGGDAIYAGNLAVVPGSPHSIVAATFANGATLNTDNSEGIYVFDDGTERGTPFGSTAVGPVLNYVAFGSSASTLYAIEPDFQNFFTLNLSASGLSQQSEISLAPTNFGYGLQYDNGLLYDYTTRSLNPSTGTIVGQLLPNMEQDGVLYTWFTADSSLNRGYAFYNNDNAPQGFQLTLQSFNLTTGQPIALTHAINTQSQYGGGTQAAQKIVRWGTNGLALGAPAGIQIISGNFVTQ
jgi:hypothetical protein